MATMVNPDALGGGWSNFRPIHYKYDASGTNGAEFVAAVDSAISQGHHIICTVEDYRYLGYHFNNSLLVTNADNSAHPGCYMLFVSWFNTNNAIQNVRLYIFDISTGAVTSEIHNYILNEK